MGAIRVVSSIEGVSVCLDVEPHEEDELGRVTKRGSVVAWLTSESHPHVDLDARNYDGSLTVDWHRGYQQALRDIAMKLDEAGPVGVAEWIRSNAAAPPGPARARSHVLAPDADALLHHAKRWHERPF